MPRCSGNFLETFWKLWRHFCIAFWNFTKRRTLTLVFTILGSFWKWMIFDSFFLKAWDGCFQRISISHYSNFFYLLFYYNVTLNVNKKFSLNSHVRAHSLQNRHAREFIKGSYSDHFQWCNQTESTEIVICLTFWLIPFFWSTMFQGKRERVLLKF